MAARYPVGTKVRIIGAIASRYGTNTEKAKRDMELRRSLIGREAVIIANNRDILRIGLPTLKVYKIRYEGPNVTPPFAIPNTMMVETAEIVPIVPLDEKLEVESRIADLIKA